MIRQGGDGDASLDLTAVSRDDLLLDVLSRRPAVRHEDAADPVAVLLQSWTAEVDDGLDEALAAPLPDVASAGVVSMAERRRRGLARGTVVAAVLGVTLSVGGVSAAVAGDPLAAYRSVAGVFTPHDDLPPTAARIAHLNRMVTNVRALARADDPAAAAALDALRAAVAAATDLSPGQRKALERKLDALQSRLDAASAPGAGQSKGRSDDAPGHTGLPPAGSGASADAEKSPKHGKDKPEPATAPRQDRATPPAPESPAATDTPDGPSPGSGDRDGGEHSRR